MATKRQVESKLRELIGRLDQTQEGVTALSQALPEPKVIQVYVSDLQQSYWAELKSGRMDGLHAGTPDRSDMRLEASSDDLVDMIDGRRSMLSSYVSGRIRIDASFSDMMRLRRLA